MSCSVEVFLAGPTSVGKSEVAMLLAERLKGEIISVDSMQVYRGMDIGTAKPTVAEQQRVPHHLIDVADLTEHFDAARFCALAATARVEITTRGRAVIFCGGTGLYFKALMSGLGESPPASPELRNQLETVPLEALLVELREKDPITFERIDQRNPRRVVRAIEVIRLTGQPFSRQRSDWRGAETEASNIIYLSRDSIDLRARINRRVDQMFAAGLVAETKRLREVGLDRNKTALQAIGYRQVVEYLNGERSLEETVALIKQRTWHFARRQLTWFRQQPEVDWVRVDAVETAETIVDRILAQLSHAG